MQTPATVFLDQTGIAYSVHSYEHDPAAPSFGLEAAARLELDPSAVFKTLMARLDDDRGPLVVAIVPVKERLNLKALARAGSAKRAVMAAVADAERSSGYVAGGISPFGQRRKVPTFIDETAEICDQVHVSGGQRGFDIGVAPVDLINSLDAVVAPLT